MKDEKDFWEKFLVLPVLVFAIYPFMKDFLFEYQNHVIEAGLAYSLSLVSAVIIFVFAHFGHKGLLK